VFDTELLTGARSLAEGVLCLTFDDGPGETSAPGGPGPRTTALAELLADEEVPATFFVCGAHVRHHPESALRVLELGHAVGNHTWSHPSLTAPGTDVLGQIRATDDALRALGVAGPIPFRPPYGDWDQGAAAAASSDGALAAGTVGVFGWDVDPQDWAAWEARASAEDAAAELVSACVAAGRGVVLLHDCSADPGDRGVRLRAGNRALESVRLALPALRGHGFTFVPLSDVSPGRR
jgi:peptidoglycan/xylan/chitin deacetylase (PgdA/CDA1 family)